METFSTFLVCFRNRNNEVRVPTQPPGEDALVSLERARFSDVLAGTGSDCRLILQVCVDDLVHPKNACCYYSTIYALVWAGGSHTFNWFFDEFLWEARMCCVYKLIFA